MAPESPAGPTHLQRAGDIAAALWIFGGAIYFYLYFSLTFYQSNRSAIDGIWGRLREILLLG